MNHNTSPYPSQQESEKKAYARHLFGDCPDNFLDVFELFLRWDNHQFQFTAFQGWIADHLGISERTVRRAVAFFKDEGWLIVPKNRSMNKVGDPRSNIYRLSPQLHQTWFRQILSPLFPTLRVWPRRLLFCISAVLPISIITAKRSDAAPILRSVSRNLPVAGDFSRQADIGLPKRTASPITPGGTPPSFPVPLANELLKREEPACTDTWLCCCEFCKYKYCWWSKKQFHDCICDKCRKKRSKFRQWAWEQSRAWDKKNRDEMNERFGVDPKPQIKPIPYTQADIEEIVRLEVGIESQEWGW